MSKKTIKIVLVPLLIIYFLDIGCTKYLEVKPDKQLVVPQTLADLEAILNTDLTMNAQYPNAGDLCTDNFYLRDKDWQGLTDLPARNAYIWKSDLQVSFDNWAATYSRIFYSNVVLDNIDIVPMGDKYNTIKGAAYFFRAYSLLKATSIYTMPYDPKTAPKEYGLPIKLSANINSKTVRASLSETYDRIINDLLASTTLLPLKADIPTKPCRPAAYGMLSNVFLIMGDYNKSLLYADSCLQLLGTTLIDFNKLDTMSTEPIPTFNSEVIFHSRIIGTSVLSPSMCLIDSALIKQYANNDLRKAIYFAKNADGTNFLKSDYDGPFFGILYSGLSSNEVYLTKAECLARLGKIVEAMDVLNLLLSKRYDRSTFILVTASTQEDAIRTILNERRKELVFRGGYRWDDLRRLNRDTKYATTLQRKINGEIYTLPANDLRYSFLIPPSVITTSGIQQNQR